MTEREWDLVEAMLQQIIDRLDKMEDRLARLENPSAAAWAATTKLESPSAAEWLEWYTMPPASRQWAATSDGWRPL